MSSIYISGGMRGLKRFNHDAFDQAEKNLLEDGFEQVVNPARIDRENGFDPDRHDESFFELEVLIRRDVDAVLSCDYVYMLRGWEKSVGATAELALAHWAKKKVLYQPGALMEDADLPEEDVLHEAYRITTTDRNNTYGPPEQDFERTAKIWSALLGIEIKPKQVAMCMIALKLSRLCWSDTKDSLIDAAGYSRCMWLCIQAEKKNGQ